MTEYLLTQEDMDRLHGAAYVGVTMGGMAPYRACLDIERILMEIAATKIVKPGDIKVDDD